MKSIFTILFVAVLSACAGHNSGAGTYFEWDAARKVEKGMTEDQVTTLLGTPYGIYEKEDGKVLFVWSYAGYNGETKSLSIPFKDGRVVSVPRMPYRD